MFLRCARSIAWSASWCALWMIACQAKADIFVSIDSGSFVQNSGIQSLNAYLRSDGADRLYALTADFALSHGIFALVPGSFGQPGQFGDGILTASSDFIRDPMDFKVSSMSLDFSDESLMNTGRLVPASDTFFATLNIDVSGLPIGTYNLGFLDVNAVPNSGSTDAFGIATTFDIIPVPEPSSAIYILLVGAASISLRRSRAIERCCHVSKMKLALRNCPLDEDAVNTAG